MPPDRRPFDRRSPPRNPNAEPGPELLGEVLSRIFAARGWGRRQERLHLEQAWVAAVTGLGPQAGPDVVRQTRVAGFRRGVLEVVVGSPIVLQEMAQFHKRRLLELLRKGLPNITVTDLRLKAGVIQHE